MTTNPQTDLIQERLAIPRQPIPKQSPADRVRNFDETYQSMGDCSRAIPFYTRAVAIGEVALGPSHPSLAAVLHELGVCNYESSATRLGRGLGFP